MKSSYSGNLNCVDVTFVDGRVEVRNTRDPQAVLTFTVAEWEAFLLGVKAGEFDLDRGEPMTAPDHGPLTDDFDAMTYTDLQRVLRVATLAGDLPSLVLAVGAELEHRDRVRDAAPQVPEGCTHPADHRCLDCATDAEVLASLPPFPGAR